MESDSSNYIKPLAGLTKVPLDTRLLERFGFVLFGLASVSAWRFVQAPELEDMLRWGAASALAFAGLALVKVWFWLELQKNAIVREVKRLEVQVASLAAASPSVALSHSLPSI